MTFLLSLRERVKKHLEVLKKKYERLSSIEAQGKLVIKTREQIVMLGLCMNSRRFLLAMELKKFA
jgi:hypothetical protein